MSATPAEVFGDTSYNHVRKVGKWNTKTTEDYVAMCKERIARNTDAQHDLAIMAEEWRKVMVKEIGRKRYNEVSKKLGGDLALSYIDYRVQQMMVDKMVRDQMPRSTMEYVLRKASDSSFLGLAQSVSHSPMQAEINKRGEAAYRPSTGEKVSARAVSFGMDVVSFGGVSSWSALARLAGAEVVFAGVEQYAEKKAAKQKTLTVEQCISDGIFGSKRNIFADLRSSAKNIKSWENPYVLSLNKRLSKPMAIATTKPISFAEIMDGAKQPKWKPCYDFAQKSGRDEKYKDVPSPIAPGTEEEYLRWQAAKQKNTAKTLDDASLPKNENMNEDEHKEPETASTDEQKMSETAESDGWQNLLTSVGLNDFGKVAHNLGYVIAMLPDLFFGMFTGKTDMRIKDNLMPIASVLLGLFVRNPLLKMTLIGMGGANLFNKAGHEVLDKHDALVKGDARPVQYRQYTEEPLNPRLQNPVLQGGNLIVSIDRVPCSIQLPQSAVNACHAGALPLSTLANAILERHDQQQAINNLAQQNYEQTQDERQVIQRK